jgi:FkbM family methyltransferase
MRKYKRVRIKLDEISYSYNSPDWDDLNEVCEEDLRDWEPISRSIFRKLAKSSKVVIDVGAYTGVYSLESALSNKNCKVIAIEPNPIAVSSLEFNININEVNNIEVLNCALSNKQGTEYMYLTDKGYGSSLASLIPTDSLELKLPVKVDIPDRLFIHLKVDLIKIDVEGFEKNVLEGFKQIVIRDRPIILTEALTLQDLHDQLDIITLLKYSPPLKVGNISGDERNYIWLPLENELAFEIVRKFIH